MERGAEILARRLLHTWALNAVAQAEALAVIAPAWGSETHPLGGGWLVLSGPGMYVNRAMNVGVDSGLSSVDLDEIVTLSRDGGVEPAVEVTPETHRDSVTALDAAGFVHDSRGDVTALEKQVTDSPIDAPDNFFVRPVRTSADLALWQETSAAGWDHVTIDRRQASDAFSAAANATGDDDMIIAFDSTDGRPVGCATTTIRDGLATLGGMSTVPAERRRGVQAALLRYRVDHACKHDCGRIATTASAGGASERNLRRHGFVPQFTIRTYTLPPPS